MGLFHAVRDKLRPLYVALRQPNSAKYARWVQDWYGVECGEGTLFNYRILVMDYGRIKVGRNCALSVCSLITHEPPAGACRDYRHGNIVIEDDCKIGMGAILIAPVGGVLTIGRGSVVGAGVTVRRSVPPGSKVLPAEPTVTPRRARDLVRAA